MFSKVGTNEACCSSDEYFSQELVVDRYLLLVICDVLKIEVARDVINTRMPFDKNITNYQGKQQQRNSGRQCGHQKLLS